MKYIFNYLIPEYYSILNGNVSINGSNLPVYDGEAPSNPTESYILIGDRFSTQLPGKKSFTSEANVLVDVVIKGNGFGFKDSEDAANQITQLINSDTEIDLSPDFQVVTTSVLSTNNLAGINPTDLTFRTLIRFRHIVKQL